jgi:hypothetical protein
VRHLVGWPSLQDMPPASDPRLFAGGHRNGSTASRHGPICIRRHSTVVNSHARLPCDSSRRPRVDSWPSGCSGHRGAGVSPGSLSAARRPPAPSLCARTPIQTHCVPPFHRHQVLAKLG